MTPRRLDSELVTRGLARSRGHARELLAADLVRVDGRPAGKAAAPVTERTMLELTEPAAPAWVGRGAAKLLAALGRFGPAGLHVAGRRCLDVGASTGGFTQVLLHEGAEHVVALDVGHGQLAPQLAMDPRVTERSGTNVRDLGGDPDGIARLGGPFDVVVVDLSFISLPLVVPTLAALTDPRGDLVMLVKPQFEVGRSGLGKGGVVRSVADRLAALHGVVTAAQQAGLGLRDVMDCPVPGATGNREYLGWWTPGSASPTDTTRVHRLLAGSAGDRREHHDEDKEGDQ